MSTPAFLVFAAPDIHEEEIAEVAACMRSGWLGTGPRVARFETDFAQYKGRSAAHVAGVNSCTAALHVNMLAAGLEPGSEVITTPLTFCATVNSILHAGLTPILADVDPLSQNIDPDAIEAAITPRTRAILPVHFAGRPCELDAINRHRCTSPVRRRTSFLSATPGLVPRAVAQRHAHREADGQPADFAEAWRWRCKSRCRNAACVPRRMNQRRAVSSTP